MLAPDTKTHFQIAPICPMQLLFLLLSVRFGLQRPLEGPRGPNEPQIVFLGTSPSDIAMIYHSWARYSASTTPGEVFRPFWTKSELLTLPRDWFTSKKALQRPKWSLWDVPQKHDFGLWPWFIVLEPRKKVYSLGERINQPVPVKMSTWDFHTAQRGPGATWKTCQKCEKSKTEALRCLRVALVGFVPHPPPEN